MEGHDLREGIFDYGEDYLLKLWQVASGLSEIHEFSVIHRDIKPSNIRIDQEGVAKIFDFGLARQQGLDNKTQGAIGTPRYIAPEMLADATINFTTAADVFSFAIASLNLLNRPLPAWNNMLPRTIPADAVASHVPEFPDELAQVLQRCLSDLPTDRPDMDEVCSKISRVLLHDKHSAQLVLAGQVSVIDKNRRDGFPKVVTVNTDTVVSGLRIHYDGNDFSVAENIGNVVANNLPILAGHKLAPSCVLAFPTSAGRPYFATFNVNQPEVFI
ncbi:MAG: protein kinase [Pseudomonadota bacterium]